MYPDWVDDRFGDDIPDWAEERWGDDDDDDDEDEDWWIPHLRVWSARPINSLVYRWQFFITFTVARLSCTG